MNEDFELKLDRIREIGKSFGADYIVDFPKPKPSKNRLTYWYPKLKMLEDVLPKTLIIPYPHYSFLEFIETGKFTENFTFETCQNLLNSCWDAVEQLNFNAFIRTDLSSAKHCGEAGCVIRRKEDLLPVLSMLVSDNELKFGIGGPIPESLVFRQHLKLNSKFEAFEGLPIANEWRFFASKEKTECFHFYWPDEAFENLHERDLPTTKDWKHKLKLLKNKTSDQKLTSLSDLAKIATREVGMAERGKTWSVDFAEDLNGKFWLIDMADAKESWHPSHTS